MKNILWNSRNLLGMGGLHENLKINEQDIREIPLEELHEFRNHPYCVRTDANMEALIESVRLHGRALTPAIARPRAEGGYELVSGHRRKFACEQLGLVTMPVIVRELDDDEAIIMMVDSNLQREHIAPSEKVFAFRMKYEAMERRGIKMEKRTADMIEENAEVSGRTVQRYIWLTYLIPELRELVDRKVIGLTKAEALSYYTEEEQEKVFQKVRKEDWGRISVEEIKKKRILTYSFRQEVLDRSSGKRHVFISESELGKYFPYYWTEGEIREEIIRLLREQWENGGIL